MNITREEVVACLQNIKPELEILLVGPRTIYVGDKRIVDIIVHDDFLSVFPDKDITIRINFTDIFEFQEWAIEQFK